MATHYTCDRCGGPAGGGSDYVHGTALLHDYNHDDGWFTPGDVEVFLQGNLRTSKEDKPDLCRSCKAEVLRAIADQLAPPLKGVDPRD